MVRHTPRALIITLLATAALAQPRDPSKPLDPPASPEALAAFPEGRDFIAEHHAFVVSRQPKDAAGNVVKNGFASLVIATQRMSGAWQYASETSEARKTYIAAHPDSLEGTADPLMLAAAGLLDPPDELLTAEGKRTIEGMEASGLFETLDEFEYATTFVAPRPLPHPDDLKDRMFLGSFRFVSRIGAARMSLALDRDDQDAFVRALKSVLVTADAADRQSDLLSHLVATDMRLRPCQRILVEFARGRLSREFAAACLPVLDAAPHPDIDAALEGEKLLMLYCIDWVCRTGEFDTLGDIPDERVGRIGVDQLLQIWLPRADMLFKADLAFRARTARALGRPLSPADEAASKAFEIMTLELPSMVRVMPISICMPAFSRAVHLHRVGEAVYDGVRAILAIELYRAKHARLPESLDALVPEFLASIPADPFGAAGAVLRYKLVDSTTDREGRDYLLYTVAGDGIDDAGREDPSLHRDTVPDATEKCKGLDYVINRGPKKPPAAPLDQPASGRAPDQR